MTIKHAIMALLLGSLLLSGCNTVAGVGKDVKAGGKSLEDTAQEHKK